MINIYGQRAASVRIQRIVYEKWNSLQVKVVEPDGSTSVVLSVDCVGFDLDHPRIPVLWETPEFAQEPERYALLAQPRETYSVKLENQPEDPHLTEIRALASAWASLTLSADEAIVAIREVLTGRPESDYPAEPNPPANDVTPGETRSPEEIRQQAAADSLDDEVLF